TQVETVINSADTTFEVEAVEPVYSTAGGNLLVAATIDRGEVVIQHTVQHRAKHMHAPIRTGGQLHMLGDGILEIAHAVEAFSIRHPGKIGGTDAHDQRRIDLGLQIGLLQVDLACAGGAVIGDVGGDVGREDTIEGVIDADIEALDVEVCAVAVAGHARTVRLVVDIGEVEIHPTADGGIVPPAGRRRRRVVGGLGSAHFRVLDFFLKSRQARL